MADTLTRLTTARPTASSGAPLQERPRSHHYRAALMGLDQGGPSPPTVGCHACAVWYQDVVIRCEAGHPNPWSAERKLSARRETKRPKVTGETLAPTETKTETSSCEVAIEEDYADPELVRPDFSFAFRSE